MKELRLYLYKKDKKEKETQPDYTGGGEEKENKEAKKSVSGWIKKDKNGKEYISIAVKDKEPYDPNKHGTFEKPKEESHKAAKEGWGLEWGGDDDIPL